MIEVSEYISLTPQFLSHLHYTYLTNTNFMITNFQECVLWLKKEKGLHNHPTPGTMIAHPCKVSSCLLKMCYFCTAEQQGKVGKLEVFMKQNAYFRKTEVSGGGEKGKVFSSSQGSQLWSMDQEG